MKGATVALKSVQSAKFLITGRDISTHTLSVFLIFCREKWE